MTVPAREQQDIVRQKDHLVIRLHHLNNRLMKLDEHRQEKHGLVQSIETM